MTNRPHTAHTGDEFTIRSFAVWTRYVGTAILIAVISSFTDPVIADVPKAISVAPMAVSPGAETGIVVNGLNLTNATNLWTDLRADIAQVSDAQNIIATYSSAFVSNSNVPDGALMREAESFDRGQYRKSGQFILNGNFKPNYAEWNFDLIADGLYVLEFRYASGESRPVELFLNGRSLTKQAAGKVTGGFGDSDAKWMAECVLSLRKGVNTIRIERSGGTPHFDKLALIPTDLPATQFSAVKPSDRVAPFKINVPDNTPVGIHGLRIATREGISNMLMFMVDDLPTAKEIRGQSSAAAGQPITQPVAVEGYCDVGRADRYTIEVSAGEELTFEVVAARLGSKLDPILKLLTADGKELAFVDDSPGFAGDCCLRHRFESGGTYLVEVEDALLSGASGHHYRLRIGDFPLITSALMSSKSNSSDVTLQFAGPAVESLPHITIDQVSDEFEPAGTEATVRTAVYDDVLNLSTTFPGKIGSGFTQVPWQPRQRSIFDPDSENNQTQVPGNVSGVLSAPSSSHSWKFSATAGQRIEFRDSLRSAGSALVLAMDICYENGRTLKSADKAGASGQQLVWSAPADGDYLLRLRDLTHRGGPEFAYLVSINEAPPNFTLSVEKDDTIVPENGYCILKVTAARDRYDGPIKLSVRGLGEDVQLRNEIIAKKKNDIRLKIYLPDNFRAGDISKFEIIGTATTENSTIERAATTLTAFRKAHPSTPFPPANLDGLIAASVAPEIPDFFSLSIDDGAILFPRHVGEVYFTVRVKGRAKGFTAPVNVRIEGFPEGFRAGGGDRAVSRSDNNEYRFQLSGPKDSAEETHSVNIIAEAAFKGQTKEVELANVPLKIIAPLIVTSKTSNPLAPGETSRITVMARRFVPRAGGDKQQINLDFIDLPSGVTVPKQTSIAAGANETSFDVAVNADVDPKTLREIKIVARTIVAGENVAVTTTLKDGDS